MGIDFFDPANQGTYADRMASRDWRESMTRLVAPAGKEIVDVGCGGGIYTRAWLDLGARRIIGIDQSAVMLEEAERSWRAQQGKQGDQVQQGPCECSFVRADACALPLASECADVVASRAMLHHLSREQLHLFVGEAYRVLRPGGVICLQDRTVDDALLQTGEGNLRGDLFTAFPRLIEIESKRRHDALTVLGVLTERAFTSITSETLWETVRVYENPDEWARCWRKRLGKSILHELTDAELFPWISSRRDAMNASGTVIERDRWTVWSAQRLSR